MRSSTDLEPLEPRRLLADFSFGDFVLNGSALFHPGGRTTVTVFIRGASDASIPTVAFKFLDVGFRPDDEHVSFDDPRAIALTSTNVADNTPAVASGKSVSYEITYSP